MNWMNVNSIGLIIIKVMIVILVTIVLLVGKLQVKYLKKFINLIYRVIL